MIRKLLILLSVFAWVFCGDLQQLIITFTQYLSNLERGKVLDQCLHDAPDWITLPKSPYIQHFDSDFSVITGHKNADFVKSNLLKHELVKAVVPDKIVSVSIKSDDKKNQYYGSSSGSSSYLDFFQRKILSVTPRSISSLVQAPVLWRRGYKGAGVKVAILDTGLQADHPHFQNVKETVDFTDEKDPTDKVIGHGTFVAGIIASSRDCLGIAPEAELYSLKVFNSQQISHTSWFLDAFNYALKMEVDILNLSIGGPDFMDVVFVNKVLELSSKGIIFISALGNDGPLYGTLNNPADQLDVIGVGGLNYDDEIAEFSSRGMTIWELPYGYGRVKPDIVTYGTAIRGSNIKGSCRYLTGTSVSSPVVAGAVTLLVEVMKKNERLSRILSPASMKQILMASAQRLPGANMFEQGSGKMSLIKAYDLLQGYVPQITVSPDKIDWTDCPYMWPYCSQPLYYTTQPTVVNMTILNGMSPEGAIVTPPTWHPNTKTNGQILAVSFNYSAVLWPWNGYLAISITVNEEGSEWAGTAEGYVLLTVNSPATTEDISDQVSTVTIPIKVNVIPTPPRSKRLLWDQFHSLGYPIGPFPRDNLKIQNAPLDWNGDHLHTNFNGIYKFLRNNGYFIEILTHQFTCFNAEHYSVLLLVDPEDEYFPNEIVKLQNDIDKKGLNLVVFADWYNGPLIKHIKFFDENTKQWVVPQSGGSNVPALNKLLNPWNIILGDKVWRGKFNIGSHYMEFASGTSILSMPDDGKVLTATLQDEAMEMIHSKKISVNDVPIFGMYYPANGSISVYGDSSCIDNAGQSTKCHWLLKEILEMVSGKDQSTMMLPSQLTTPFRSSFRYPKLAPTPLFHKYSRVVTSLNGMSAFRPEPTCPKFTPAEMRDYNDTFPIGRLNNKLLSLDVEKDNIEPFLLEDFVEGDDNSLKLFYILGFIVIISVIIVLLFLYSVYSLFHKKRIVFYQVKTRRRV